METRGNAFAADAQGERALLSSDGQQVMMQWERRYMERCVDALGVRAGVDRVLEIGFGLALSAAHIQRLRPRSHTIVECDAAVLERAEAFARQHRGVEVVRGLWQQALPALGEFDCVFFDDFPLPEVEARLGVKAAAPTAGRSRWHDFLDVALLHVTQGARITGYLARDVDLRRPGCSVEVTKMEVQPSADCKYFPYDTALVPVITVLDVVAARQPGAQHPQQYKPLTLAPSRRSKRFVDAFIKAREARDELEDVDSLVFADYDELEGKASASSDKESDANESSQDDKPARYADADSRKSFLQSLREAKARKQQSPTTSSPQPTPSLS